MLDTLEEMEEDYTWEKIKKGIDLEICKGSYLFENYIIIESFETPDETELHFLTYNDSTENLEINNVDDLYRNMDFTEDILGGFRIEIDNDRMLSIYKDEKDYLILNHLKNEVKVYETDEYLEEILKDELEDFLIDSSLLEKQDKEEIDYFTLGILYAALNNFFKTNDSKK